LIRYSWRRIIGYIAFTTILDFFLGIYTTDLWLQTGGHNHITITIGNPGVGEPASEPGTSGISSPTGIGTV
jgi:hypothetical protein